MSNAGKKHRTQKENRTTLEEHEDASRVDREGMDISDSVIDSVLGTLGSTTEDNSTTSEEKATEEETNYFHEQVLARIFSEKKEGESSGEARLLDEYSSPIPGDDATNAYRNNQSRKVGRTKKQLLVRGIQCYQHGEFEDAIMMFKMALRWDPDSVVTHMMLGATFFQNRMFGEAAEVYKRLRQLDPQSISAPENLGHVYCAQGNFAAAAIEWKRLINNVPERVDLTEKIRRISAKKGTRCVGWDGRDRTKLIAAGVESYRQQNYPLSIRAFKLAAKFFPDAGICSFLGNVYFRRHDLKLAATAYEQAAAFDLKDITILENLSKIYARQGAIDLAIEVWERILKIDPERDDIVTKIDEVIHLSK